MPATPPVSPSSRADRRVPRPAPSTRWPAWIARSKRPRARVLQALAALLLLLIVHASTKAAVIRHDRTDHYHNRLADRGPHTAVGRVSTDAALGSGTLIGQRFVLTAAHVVDYASTIDFQIAGRSYRARNWHTLPGWNGNLAAGRDLALILLNENVTLTSGVAPAPLGLRRSVRSRWASEAGYGLGGNGVTGTRYGTAEKRAGRNRIDRVTAGGRLLWSDFDRPGTPRDSPLGSPDPNFAESLVSFGDSGGGLFVIQNRRWRLAGVHSFIAATDGIIDADYGDLSGHTAVGPYRRWVFRTARRLVKMRARTSAISDTPSALSALAAEQAAAQFLTEQSIALAPTARAANGPVATSLLARPAALPLTHRSTSLDNLAAPASALTPTSASTPTPTPIVIPEPHTLLTLSLAACIALPRQHRRRRAARRRF